MGSSEGALYFETRYYGLAVGQAEATVGILLEVKKETFHPATQQVARS